MELVEATKMNYSDELDSKHSSIGRNLIAQMIGHSLLVDITYFRLNSFCLDEFFLIIGGKENSPAGREISAAIETKIPCQLEKAMLKFE